MKVPFSVLSSAYRNLLRLYPASFRTEFGEEMVQIFDCALRGARIEGKITLISFCWRELVDLPNAVRREWAFRRRSRETARREGPMDSTQSLLTNRPPAEPPPEVPATWNLALLAALPLLLAGLGLALTQVPMLQDWWILLTFGPYLVILGGLIWAWAQSFPRWSYSFLSYGLLFALFLSRVSTPGLAVLGYTFGRHDPWGWRALLPLGTALLAGLLITRSLRPAVCLVTGAWRDWTRLSFALYATLPLVLSIMWDEAHSPYPVPFMLMSTFCLSAGAVAYMRGAGARGRELALLAGLASGWLVCTVGVSSYWHDRLVGRSTAPLHWSDNAVPMAIAGMIVAALVLAPAVLGLLRRGGRRASAA